VLAILWKDLRIEWRTREMLSSLVVLGVLLVATLGFAGQAGTVEASAGRLGGALWVSFLFAGMLGIQRSFLLEREDGGLSGLLVSPLDPARIYLAKLAGNVTVLACMQALLVPLGALFIGVPVALARVPALALVLLLGNLGFAAVATVFAAVAVRTRAREVMLPVLVLPLLLPLVILAVRATGGVLGGGGLADVQAVVGYLVAFDVIYTSAGWMLFEFIVRE
jgi:heme exporter protein B